MNSMTFLINDSSTGGTTPVVTIVITENADGTVTFVVTQQAGYVGDLRGLFFDVADETLIGSLSATASANLTEFQQGNDTVTDLGNGANMQGLLGDAGGYDVGVEIGSSGLKTTDDVRSFTFTLDSSLRDLTLADFSNVCFGARITSVGQDSNLDGTFETSRSGSSKTGEVTFAVITPTKDDGTVSEDGTASGNVLANDGAGAGDVLSVTGWSGGALGTEYAFVELNYAKIKLNANGTYTIDATAADALGEGESVSHTFTYDVLQNNVDGTSTHTVSFKVTIIGTNDAPVIAGELFTGGVTEAGSNADTGTLSTSDSFSFDDADLSDTHTVGFTPVGATLGTLSALSITDPATGAGDGTVGWTYSVNAADVAYLAQGETLVESFTVTVTDVNGLTDTATVQVTVTGTNDAPVIAGELFTGGVTEAGSNADTGTLSTSDSFSFDDLDLSDTHSVAFVPVGTTLGTLSALSITDPATGAGDGTVGWTYSVNAADVAYLAQGETLVESFTVTVTDVNGLTDSATVQVTITGTNDAPVIAGELFTGGVTEAGSNADTGTLSTSDSFSFDDADLSDAHTVGFTPVGATLGTLSALSITDPATGAGDGTVGWTYSVNAADVAYLAEGETLVESFTVTVTDVNGLTDTATVQVTVTGTNDAPIVAVVDVLGAVTELGIPSGNLTDSGTIAFSDVDLSDVHSVGPVTPSAGALGTLTSSVTTQASDVDGTGGVITWNYSVAASAVEYLAKNETKTELFTFTLSDDHGGTVDRTVQVTITGTNDAPDLSVVTSDSAAATLTETNSGLTTSGTLTATDVDLIDVISSTVSGVVASGTTSGLGLTNAQLLAMMSVAPTSGLAANAGDAHNLTWSFNSGSEAFNYLNSGQSLVLTYTVASSDGQGGSDTQAVSVTINGTADGPTDIVLTGNTPGQINIPQNTIGQFTAIGASGAVSFSATLVEKNLAGTTQSDATPDVTVSSTGVLTGVSGSNGIEEGRIYELNVTATDSGGSLTQLFRVVTGTTGGDTINLSTSSEDLVFLASGNDTIFTGSGDDTVYGQSGTDLIHAGDGNDVLYGMNGNDTFYFDTAPNAATNVDTIKDFNASNADKLFLSTAVFAGIGSGTGTLAASDYASVNSGGTGDVSSLSVGASVNIVFDSSTGGLYYDANGASLADATKFAVIDLAGLSGTFDNADITFGP